jgi:multiple sugar transport system substrate-binding protein
VLEYFWSNGGNVLQDGRVVINNPKNIYALRFMRDLIVKYNVTPPLVTTAIEEPTRHVFGNGNALFMRNWPYAWNIFDKEGSPVKGDVGVTMLPSFPKGTPASTLGGWQLGINRYSKHLARSIGYKPTRKTLYTDEDLIREQPFIAGLYEIFMKARPRPVSPYYMMMTQVMQPEFSAALSGIKIPEEALRSAQKQIEHILKTEQ